MFQSKIKTENHNLAIIEFTSFLNCHKTDNCLFPKQVNEKTIRD